jgi:hypothetical protein
MKTEFSGVSRIRPTCIEVHHVFYLTMFVSRTLYEPFFFSKFIALPGKGHASCQLRANI